MTPAVPDSAAVSDAVFKTFVESALLLAVSAAHFAVGLSPEAAIALLLALLGGSMLADKYMFGSVGRAMAARRAMHFKASPFLVAATLIVLLLPVDGTSDKIVRWALAAGIGGTVTGLLNLGRWRRADA